MTDTSARDLLNLPLGDNDAGALTVRGYLINLLATVWAEGEGFSGKRPFGNSSWEYDLFVPMIRAGIVDGRLDKDGYVEHIDRHAADALVSAAIWELGR